MKRLTTLGGVVICLTGQVHAGVVDAGLADVFRQAAPGEVISALVYLEDRVDIAATSRQLDIQRANRKTRHEAVVRALQDKAVATQGGLTAHLNALLAEGRIQRFDTFWIGNIIRVDAVAGEIKLIAQRPDVERVYFNCRIELIQPVAARPPQGGAAGRAVEPGVLAVRAPEVWGMGFDGSGTLVATLDTGVDGTHPALASRWRGNDLDYAGNPEWAWFDPVTNTTFPQAYGSHGTHTMGTVCGGAPGDEVGVAPGAQWIHAAVIDRVNIPTTISDALLAFEWMVDPDGNPATDFDVPDVCSNSWGLADVHGVPDCDQLFWAPLDACEAVGVVMVFSAGNEGFSGLRRPADRATDEYRTLAVAAVDGNVGSWPIASFSSRGPTFCTPGGQAAIKPDIAAPGVDVRSAVPGGYGFFDGTSMASPHVNGVVALMLQANPDLAVEQVKQIIYDTAFDLGAAGEDNDYGWGMIDAVQCVQQALSTVALTFTFPDGRPEIFDPLGGTTIRVIVAGSAVNPVPGTGMFYYSTGGPFTEAAMNQTVPNEYEAVFPSFDCLANVDYYFSADGDSGDTFFSPFSAPAATYRADVYSGIAFGFQDNFETDQGWTREILGATTGWWERGVPVDDPGWQYDPTSDGDGSGQCYLTQNEIGNTDVDGGAVRLTSPKLDMSGGGTLSYDYYLNLTNSSGADMLLVEASNDSGVGPWAEVARHDTNGGLSWRSHEITGDDLIAAGVPPTGTMQFRFTANDADPQSIVEAGLDGVEIIELFCEEANPCPDINGDGVAGILDFLLMLAAWGRNAGHPADFDGDGAVGIPDFLILLADWGPCP